MNNLKTVRMEDHSILMIVSTLIGALGIKEIWGIIKQKIDIGAKKDEREESWIAYGDSSEQDVRGYRFVDPHQKLLCKWFIDETIDEAE